MTSSRSLASAYRQLGLFPTSAKPHVSCKKPLLAKLEGSKPMRVSCPFREAITPGGSDRAIKLARGCAQLIGATHKTFGATALSHGRDVSKACRAELGPIPLRRRRCGRGGSSACRRCLTGFLRRFASPLTATVDRGAGDVQITCDLARLFPRVQLLHHLVAVHLACGQALYRRKADHAG